jgi:4-amino-4-deoxy-L-arabinose transferase-like glycosyltransferase
MATILIICSRYGIGLSPDSVTYIAGSRNLLAGKGYVSFDESPIVLWPPLYSLFLSAISFLLAADPLSLAAGVHTLLYGLNLYLSGVLLLRYTRSIGLTILGLLLAASWPLTKVSSMAWSEPLFICLLLLFLLRLDSYLEAPKVRWLLALSLLAALATLTRYAGVVLILTGLLSLVLNSRLSWKTRLAHSALFALLSAIPITLWLVRNWIICGSFFGLHVPKPYSFLDSVLCILERIYFWFLPDSVLLSRSLVFGPTILALILFSFALSFYVRHATLDDRQRFKEVLLGVGHLLIFILCYIGIFMLPPISYQNLSARLLTPLYVPLFALVLSLGREFALWLKKHFPERFVHRPLRAVAWLLALGCAAEIAGIAGFRAINGAGGYNSASWRKSEILQNLPPSCEPGVILYSNAPDAIYILTGRPALRSPAKYVKASPDQALAALKFSWPPTSQADLVWFDSVHRDYLFSVSELQTVADVSIRARFSDGAIYEVWPKRK